MAKQLIQQVKCPQCGKMFDVNTEDIEWEHVVEIGENAVDHSKHNYVCVQKLECPHCHHKNVICYRAVGDFPLGNIVSQDIMITSGDDPMLQAVMKYNEILRAYLKPQAK